METKIITMDSMQRQLSTVNKHMILAVISRRNVERLEERTLETRRVLNEFLFVGRYEECEGHC